MQSSVLKFSGVTILQGVEFSDFHRFLLAPYNSAARSASTKKYQIPRTRTKFAERSFSYAGPAAWNGTLPHYVHEITDSAVFKRHLKSVLFRRAFLDSL